MGWLHEHFWPWPPDSRVLASGDRLRHYQIISLLTHCTWGGWPSLQGVEGAKENWWILDFLCLDSSEWAFQGTDGLNLLFLQDMRSLKLVSFVSIPRGCRIHFLNPQPTLAYFCQTRPPGGRESKRLTTEHGCFRLILCSSDTSPAYVLKMLHLLWWGGEAAREGSNQFIFIPM